ncbi:MAG TPA: primosomal protein N', partial [Victivallales bacterium]|nr:primosomal protein N' [Victivallales bacterium]
ENLIKEESVDFYRNPFENRQIIRSAPPTLTEEQKAIVGEILTHLEQNPNSPGTFLLHGVTGSGKTEVYLQILNKIISSGKDAIVLVPEIALTPQTTDRFRARFGDNISVLHSSLSDGERYDEWMRIYRGKVKIAIGARSALFAPFRNLGAIIVDEEHEPSYKQEESPRYNARDMAVMRGKFENSLVLLGSATPSLESYYNANIGKYKLCELTKRVDNRLMPQVTVIDMRVENKSTSKLFSNTLINAIHKRIIDGEQTIIFLNRKGFATNMTCLSCGWNAECQQCSVSYTYHKERQSLSCHLCADIKPAPLVCPSCGDKQIRMTGAGTEKIEIICKKIFKNAKIARMDAETMTGRDKYEKVLSDFRTGKIQILIGTQMIAKGLDFPNVTLVGIICADISLHIPDFRSEERTFQLLTQVAGRAGRGDRPGEVIIQTFNPSNPAILFALKHDFKSFFNYEIDVRKKFFYPPITHMLALYFKSKNEDDIIKIADQLIVDLKPFLNKEIHITGPTPAPIPKIKGNFRYIILFKGNKLGLIKKQLKYLIYSKYKNKNVLIYADSDPVSLAK